MDYDRALYYTHRSEWDNLLILMVRTKDNFLSKKIESFLHAYNFEHNYSVIEENLYSLKNRIPPPKRCPSNEGHLFYGESLFFIFYFIYIMSSVLQLSHCSILALSS
jgi:hypothetical protein